MPLQTQRPNEWVRGNKRDRIRPIVNYRENGNVLAQIYVAQNTTVWKNSSRHTDTWEPYSPLLWNNGLYPVLQWAGVTTSNTTHSEEYADYTHWTMSMSSESESESVTVAVVWTGPVSNPGLEEAKAALTGGYIRYPERNHYLADGTQYHPYGGPYYQNYEYIGDDPQGNALFTWTFRWMWARYDFSILYVDHNAFLMHGTSTTTQSRNTVVTATVDLLDGTGAVITTASTQLTDTGSSSSTTTTTRSDTGPFGYFPNTFDPYVTPIHSWYNSGIVWTDNRPGDAVVTTTSTISPQEKSWTPWVWSALPTMRFSAVRYTVTNPTTVTSYLVLYTYDSQPREWWKMENP